MELGLPDGLGKVAVEARFEAAIAVTLHGMGRQGRDVDVASRRGLALSNGPECLEAVHRGHLQIHEDGVEIVGLERLEHLKAVRDDDYRMAHPLEHPDGHFLVHRMVLRQQDVQRSPLECSGQRGPRPVYIRSARHRAGKLHAGATVTASSNSDWPDGLGQAGRDLELTGRRRRPRVGQLDVSMSTSQPQRSKARYECERAEDPVHPYRASYSHQNDRERPAWCRGGSQHVPGLSGRRGRRPAGHASWTRTSLKIMRLVALSSTIKIGQPVSRTDFSSAG